MISPDLTGVVVFTASGNFNGNCSSHQGGSGGASGGGALVIDCAVAPQFGPAFDGKIVVSPSGAVNANCHFHTR